MCSVEGVCTNRGCTQSCICKLDYFAWTFFQNPPFHVPHPGLLASIWLASRPPLRGDTRTGPALPKLPPPCAAHPAVSTRTNCCLLSKQHAAVSLHSWLMMVWHRICSDGHPHADRICEVCVSYVFDNAFAFKANLLSLQQSALWLCKPMSHTLTSTYQAFMELSNYSQ